MVLIIVIAVIALLVLWFIGVANKLTKLRMKAENAFADIDVYLKKRYDLIPNIVSTVKGYAKHEKDTLEGVINARNKAVSAEGVDAKIDADNQVTQAISKLFALTESYPELKANENFMDLQKQLQKIEDDISGARQYFNATVRKYNYAVKVIPDCIVASILHCEVMSMFKATDEERENVKVDFEN